MDPIGISSGIAGLITLALAIGVSLNDYVDAVSSAPRVVTELRDELALLSNVLKDLSNVAPEEAAGVWNAQSVFQKSLHAYEARLRHAKDRLDGAGYGRLSSTSLSEASKREHFKQTLEKAIWPFREKEAQSLIEGLRRFQAVFTFAISVEGWKVLAQTSENVAVGVQLQLVTLQKIEEMANQVEGMLDAANRAVEQRKHLENILTILPDLDDLQEDMQIIGRGMKDLEARTLGNGYSQLYASAGS